jgi:hypothetical protein
MSLMNEFVKFVWSLSQRVEALGLKKGTDSTHSSEVSVWIRGDYSESPRIKGRQRETGVGGQLEFVRYIRLYSIPNRFMFSVHLSPNWQ